MLYVCVVEFLQVGYVLCIDYVGCGYVQVWEEVFQLVIEDFVVKVVVFGNCIYQGLFVYFVGRYLCQVCKMVVSGSVCCEVKYYYQVEKIRGDGQYYYFFFGEGGDVFYY